MKNYWNFYLSCKQQQLYGPVNYRDFQETGPSPTNRAGSLHTIGPYSLHWFFLLVEFNRVPDNGIIIKDLRYHSNVSVSSSLIKTTGKQTSYLFFSVRLSPQDSGIMLWLDKCLHVNDRFAVRLTVSHSFNIMLLQFGKKIFKNTDFGLAIQISLRDFSLIPRLQEEQKVCL